MKLEREIKDVVLMSGDIIGGKIMPGTIRAVMWTNGAMLLVMTVPGSPDSTGDYAIVSGWEAIWKAEGTNSTKTSGTGSESRGCEQR